MSGQEYSRSKIGPHLWSVRRACGVCDGEGGDCDHCDRGVVTELEDDRDDGSDDE